MTSIFIVRAENSGAPESTIFGVYPTIELAQARMEVVQGEDFGYDIVFFDEVMVGPNGGDCDCANR